MNRLLIATLSIGALTLGAANAADLRAPVKAPVAVAPACAQFGGFYLGGHGGWGNYRHDHADRGNLVQTVDDDLPTVTHQTDNSWLAGGQIGWNWQRNCTVFGVETDWSWTGLKAEATFLDGDTGSQDSLTVSSRLRWFGTVRARAGLVVDNLLLYVTGGLAYANFRRDYSIFEDTAVPPATVVFSANRTRLGWTAGFGTEWAWTGNWSIKSEVLYMRFINDNVNFIGVNVGGQNIGVPGRAYTFASQDEVWVGRIGLNYRWGGSPVVARY